MKTFFAILFSACLTVSISSCKKLTEDEVCLPPANLVATGITQSKADIEWTAANDGVQYIVFLKKSTESTYTEFGRTKSTTLTVTGLTAGQDYDCRIQTNCPGANSVNGDPIRFRTLTEKEFFISRKWKPDFWKVNGIPLVIQSGDYLDFKADSTYEQRVSGATASGSWFFTNSGQTNFKVELGGGQVVEWKINTLNTGNADFSGINATAGDTLNLSPF